MGNKNLNILAVPDGYMHHFPLELLPVFSESDTTKRFYLGEIANISYVPSLSSYVKLSSKKKKDVKKDDVLLVSANPSQQSSINYMDNLFVLRSEYGDLKHVDDEIKAIDKTFSKGDYLKRELKQLCLILKLSQNKV